MNNVRVVRFRKRMLNLNVAGLSPLPATLDGWELALVQPALAHLLDPASQATTAPAHKEVADENER